MKKIATTRAHLSHMYSISFPDPKLHFPPLSGQTLTGGCPSQDLREHDLIWQGGGTIAFSDLYKSLKSRRHVPHYMNEFTNVGAPAAAAIGIFPLIHNDCCIPGDKTHFACERLFCGNNCATTQANSSKRRVLYHKIV